MVLRTYLLAGISRDPAIPVRPFPPPVRPQNRGFLGAAGLNRTSAFTGNAPLAIIPPGCAPRIKMDWPSIGVAYFLLVYSRLGYSPKLGLDRGYHTTSCISQGNTNPLRDKKISGLLRFPSGRPYLRPVGQRTEGFSRLRKRWRIAAEGLSPINALMIPQTTRGLHICPII
jgi:hypothetical protein